MKVLLSKPVSDKPKIELGDFFQNTESPEEFYIAIEVKPEFLILQNLNGKTRWGSYSDMDALRTSVEEYVKRNSLRHFPAGMFNLLLQDVKA